MTSSLAASPFAGPSADHDHLRSILATATAVSFPIPELPPVIMHVFPEIQPCAVPLNPVGPRDMQTRNGLMPSSRAECSTLGVGSCGRRGWLEPSHEFLGIHHFSKLPAQGSQRSLMDEASALYLSPWMPTLACATVASETTKVLNPRFPAILAVVETQWSVVMPVMTTSRTRLP